MLTGKAKQDFNRQKPWYFRFLPNSYKNLIVYRWLVTEGKIPIDIWARNNEGFSYTVTNPDIEKDIVYICSGKVGNWNKSFDNNIERAIHIANIVYNDPSIMNIPRQFFD